MGSLTPPPVLNLVSTDRSWVCRAAVVYPVAGREDHGLPQLLQMKSPGAPWNITHARGVPLVGISPAQKGNGMVR